MAEIAFLGVRARSGYSDMLGEAFFLGNPAWTTPNASGLKQTVDPFIVFQPGPPVRYLTQGEQRVMKEALIRSTRLVSRG